MHLHTTCQLTHTFSYFLSFDPLSPTLRQQEENHYSYLRYEERDAKKLRLCPILIQFISEGARASSRDSNSQSKFLHVPLKFTEVEGGFEQNMEDGLCIGLLGLL